MKRPLVVCAERVDRAEPYLGALVACGVPADAIRLVTPETDAATEGLEELGALAAGLLLSGGPDVEPHRYGETPIAEAGVTSMPDLDRIESAILSGAHAAKTPVFGICRGMQVINVHLGGTLYQDVQLQLPGVEEHYIRVAPDHLAHPVQVTDEATPIGELFSRRGARTNSRHHQAVKAMGHDLLPVGYSPDGLLEIMQLPPEGWWVWAVQWHPENLLADEQQRELWRRFVAAARHHEKAAPAATSAEAR